MFPIVALGDRWRRSAEATAIANLATQEHLNRLKSQFLIRISHQFRTALVGIEGFSEVIRDSEQLDLEEVKAFATDIHNDAERLDQAFSRMLTLDEMEAGHVAVDESTCGRNRAVRAGAERAPKPTLRTLTVMPGPPSPTDGTATQPRR